MLSPSPSWTVRGATFALWLLAAASAAYWGLQLGGGPARVAPPAASARGLAAVDPGAIARLLGGAGAASAAAPLPSLASRFALVGVVAGERSGGGAAVIAVDGRPARPFRVGSAVDEGLVLQSVQGRQAVLGPPDGAAVLTLELPPLAGPTVQGGATKAAPTVQRGTTRAAPQVQRGTPKAAPR